MRPLFTQQVTFIYTRDLDTGSAFLGKILGLRRVLNQSDLCHIYEVVPNAYLGICVDHEPPKNPGLTYSFVSDDVDAHYTLLVERGVEFEAPPAYSEKFQVYSAFFRGPENYRFELQTFRDPDWTTKTTITEPT
ncbi:MAG: glyoxalase [Rhodospirillaceae bacterium]|nr:glyoxalase [Rhodospirillaceae bacterium]